MAGEAVAGEVGSRSGLDARQLLSLDAVGAAVELGLDVDARGGFAASSSAAAAAVAVEVALAVALLRQLDAVAVVGSPSR